MTPEQLDEIEKLADGWHRTVLTQYAEEVADNGRALVKAVREAQKERDEAQHKVGQLRGLLRLVWEDACNQEAGFLDEVCDAVEVVLAEEA